METRRQGQRPSHVQSTVAHFCVLHIHRDAVQMRRCGRCDVFPVVAAVFGAQDATVAADDEPHSVDHLAAKRRYKITCGIARYNAVHGAGGRFSILICPEEGAESMPDRPIEFQATIFDDRPFRVWKKWSLAGSVDGLVAEFARETDVALEFERRAECRGRGVRGEDGLPPVHSLPLVEACRTPCCHAKCSDCVIVALEGATVNITRSARRLVKDIDERLEFTVDGRREHEPILARVITVEVGDGMHPILTVPWVIVQRAVLPPLVPVSTRSV